MSLKVKALHRGYYNNMLRRAGDVFTLARGEDFSARWMVRAWNDAPDAHRTAQRALDAEHDRAGPAGQVRRVAQPVEDEPEVLHDFDPFTW
jgi:hypothetical protein